jgi:prepilin peptidase CpaA
MLPLFAALTAVLFAALVVFAAARDALSFTIPNWISGGLVLLFVPAALANGLGWPAFGLHLGVGAAALVAGMVMFALRWMGGGDAKLLAAVALWLGWPAVLTFLGAAAIAGGGLAVVLLALRATALRPFVLLGPPWVVRLAEPGEAVPYGVAIALGALVALPGSPLAAGLAL